jgi:nicotinamide phosphoribosyltransferase
MQHTKLTFGGFTLSDEKSILMNTDSYKVGMDEQYPPNTKHVFSYIESRGGKHTEQVMFGTQAFIQEYLSTPFTLEDVEFANVYWQAHGEPFPYENIKEMFYAYSGFWPVTIRAVPEGTIVPTKNIMAMVYNEDPRFKIATTWLETSFLRAVWYGSTVATNCREIRKTILRYLVKSGTTADLPWKLHGFGARGASSFETAAIGDLASLVTGMGTDTMTANLYAMRYYGATGPVGFSIVASEHSTITSWGRENEFKAYKNMVEKFAKQGATFACVSDSYNIYEACRMWGQLANEIKEKGATLVVRPDSGDPLVVMPQCMRILEEAFGYTVIKGYKVLNNVRMLWGDGITDLTIESILRTMVDLHGYSADNFAFGQGGAMLQIVNRDDQKYAMKCSAVGVEVNGVLEWHDVFKDPITDQGKTSKKGRISLYKDAEGNFYTDKLVESSDAMVTLYRNGVQLNCTTYEEIRERAKII